METMFGHDLAGVDVPPFSYTGIAHTCKNSPFNEYPYPMARLRWFTDSFRPPGDRMRGLASRLQDLGNRNLHFAYLQVSDAGRIDDLLDAIYLEVTGVGRGARECGPHEPGLGRWVPEDEFNEQYTLGLRHGVDRQEMFGRVADDLRARNSEELTFDDLYLYPPRYGNRPDDQVRHTFRIFGHTDAVDRATARLHLREAVTLVLRQASTQLG